MNRREALLTIAAAAAAPALEAQAAGPFTAGDLEILAHLADIVIPPTATPGGSAAGVHFYIERLAARRPLLASTLNRQLAQLREANFLELPAARQIALFTEGPLFGIIKDLTIDGYYSSKPGLAGELGWHGNTYVQTFEGCTHAEHGAPAGGSVAD
jgi:hypothetical protein